MSTNFESDIKDWVRIDDEIKNLNDIIKTLREERNNKTTKIINYVDTNNLKNASVNITDGKLKFVTAKQVSQLTLKHVEECLTKCITNKEQVDIIIKYIKESKPTKVVSEIKRSYFNN